MTAVSQALAVLAAIVSLLALLPMLVLAALALNLAFRAGRLSNSGERDESPVRRVK